MILLCCKEMNTKKEKNKNKQSTDRRGRTKLQLKGRIFMQNVTDTVCQSKPGLSTPRGDGVCELTLIKASTHAKSSGKAIQVSNILRSSSRQKRRCESGRAL